MRAQIRLEIILGRILFTAYDLGNERAGNNLDINSTHKEHVLYVMSQA